MAQRIRILATLPGTQASFPAPTWQLTGLYGHQVDKSCRHTCRRNALKNYNKKKTDGHQMTLKARGNLVK